MDLNVADCTRGPWIHANGLIQCPETSNCYSLLSNTTKIPNLEGNLKLASQSSLLYVDGNIAFRDLGDPCGKPSPSPVVYCHGCGAVCTAREAVKQLHRERKTCKKCFYVVEDRMELRFAKQEQRIAELEKTLEELITMLRECPPAKTNAACLP